MQNFGEEFEREFKIITKITLLEFLLIFWT